MLLNYLKISIRYLVRNGTFTIINLFGLTLGFLSFLILALYVHDELSFDSFHTGKEFVFIVLLSAVVALPVAWYLVDSWLNDFAYRVTLRPGVFIIAALLAGLIATVTVVIRTVGTARANPVKWLRGE